MKIKSLAKLALIGASAFASASLAQSFPDTSKPISVVVPFGAGAGTDVITRIIAEEMSKDLGTSIVVQNKAGASGQIGTEFVAKAEPDGYTLLVGTNSTHSGNPYLFKSLRYDPFEDFEPIGRLTINPLALLVNPDSQFKTAAELINYGRENPGKLTYGYGNTGGQVSGGMLVHMANIDAVVVPYKTTPQLFVDIVNGQVDFGFVDFAASRSFIESGRLRALGTTSSEPVPLFPDIASISETPGMEKFGLYAWLGLFAPAGTPDDVVARLNASLNKVLNQPATRKQLEEGTSSVVIPTTVKEFKEFMVEQDELWKTSIQAAGMQPQ